MHRSPHSQLTTPTRHWYHAPMIVDGHAHAFPFLGDASGFPSAEHHVRLLQRHFTTHPQGARRVSRQPGGDRADPLGRRDARLRGPAGRQLPRRAVRALRVGEGRRGVLHPVAAAAPGRERRQPGADAGPDAVPRRRSGAPPARLPLRPDRRVAGRDREGVPGPVPGLPLRRREPASGRVRDRAPLSLRPRAGPDRALPGQRPLLVGRPGGGVRGGAVRAVLGGRPGAGRPGPLGHPLRPAPRAGRLPRRGRSGCTGSRGSSRRSGTSTPTASRPRRSTPTAASRTRSWRCSREPNVTLELLFPLLYGAGLGVPVRRGPAADPRRCTRSSAPASCSGARTCRTSSGAAPTARR